MKSEFLPVVNDNEVFLCIEKQKLMKDDDGVGSHQMRLDLKDLWPWLEELLVFWLEHQHNSQFVKVAVNGT